MYTYITLLLYKVCNNNIATVAYIFQFYNNGYFTPYPKMKQIEKNQFEENK